MAKFDKKILLSAINLRLMAPVTKKKCLEKGISALEDVICKVILQLDETLKLNLTLYQISILCFEPFMYAQDMNDIHNGEALTEKDIDAYIADYIHWVKDMVGEDKSRIPQIKLNINFQDIINNIRANLIKIQQDVSEYSYNDILTEVINPGIEAYFEYLNDRNASLQLSNIRYQAVYYSRRSCPEILLGQSLSKELCNNFIENFLYHFENIIYCQGVTPLYLK